MAVQINLTATEAELWNNYLKMSNVDLDELRLPPNQTVFRKTVDFSDGRFADLEVFTDTDAFYCQMVWYAANGTEIACSDADADSLDGLWECSLGEDYDVEVVVK